MLVTEAPQKDRNLTLTSGSDPDRPNFAHKELLQQPAHFVRRHVGPGTAETSEMLALVGFSSLDALVNEAVPASIRLAPPLQLPPARSEFDVLSALKEIASQNQVFRS